jgi:hypothetical protein
MDVQKAKEFRAALDNACGEINEAARLSVDLFDGDNLKVVRRELGRLMEIVHSRILAKLPQESDRS